MTVRRTGGADWASLRTIRLEALADTPEAFGTTHAEASRYRDRRWRTMAEESPYFLAEVDGRVVGMVRGGQNEHYPGTFWLYGMYVTPSQRGGGVARALVDAVVAWALAEGATELYLHVGVGVARARAFYEKVGFAPTGERFAVRGERNLELETMVKQLVVA
jgi:GNAT superfamily N-acetyltransferase